MKTTIRSEIAAGELYAEVKLSRTNRRDNSDGTLYSLSEFVMQTTVELSKSIFLRY